MNHELAGRSADTADRRPAGFCGCSDAQKPEIPGVHRLQRRLRFLRSACRRGPGKRMNVSDILLIAALAVGCASAIYYSVRRARKGSGCCGDIAGKVRRTGPADHKRSLYGFRAEAEITGMTCDNCAARVENALNSLEGIWASVRIDTGKARILSKETVDERKIREAVRGAGYGVGKLKT